VTVNKFLMPVLVIATLLGSVVVAKTTGDWSVSGREMFDAQNLTSGEDVRGWMTLEQLSQGFAIPLEELYAMLAIPVEVEPNTALKDLEKIMPDFEVSMVRERIEDYLNQSSPDPDSNASMDANSVLSEDAFLDLGLPTEEYMTPEAVVESGREHGISPLANGEYLAGNQIKGRHTLQEISDQCRVPLDELLPALGLSTEVDLTLKIKDLLEQGRLVDIQSVRDVVTSLQKP
jgi:hypothetical protein